MYPSIFIRWSIHPSICQSIGRFVTLPRKAPFQHIKAKQEKTQIITSSFHQHEGDRTEHGPAHTKFSPFIIQNCEDASLASLAFLISLLFRMI